MTTTALAQDRIAGSWRFDPIHSAATFRVKYLVAPFRAEFERFKAELVDGRLTGSVDVESLNISDEQFRAQVLGADFFEIERFPEISFSADELGVDGDDLVVEGELTIKDVTKPIRTTGTIEGPTEDFMRRTRLGLALTATIDRTDYGLRWNAPLPGGGNALADEVSIVVDLEFIQSE